VTAQAANGTPPHGFDEDPATRRLLRSRPPGDALAWAGAALGATVVSARALRGGMSSAVHALTVAFPGGRTERVVLRRYVRPEVNAEEPGIVDREDRALRFVQGLDVPTPRVLATDPDGTEADVSALLMSHLPGRVEWSPPDMERWLFRLARLLPRVHVAVPRSLVIRPFEPYAQECYDPPPWARRPAVWARATEIFHDPPPPDPAVFIHRDFHPGNVLWRRGSVTGLVDWQSASMGPASVDVGHCRGNLLRYGLDVVDRFTTIWENITGLTYHPWADIVAIIGFLDALHEDPPSDRFVIEDALARSVAELG
jgi:aminoglycoside phosphotransferase (APT) family kinase protein